MELNIICILMTLPNPQNLSLTIQIQVLYFLIDILLGCVMGILNFTHHKFVKWYFPQTSSSCSLPHLSKPRPHYFSSPSTKPCLKSPLLFFVSHATSGSSGNPIGPIFQNMLKIQLFYKTQLISPWSKFLLSLT